MSIENQKTLEIYKEKANVYMSNNQRHELLNPEMEYQKRNYVRNLIKKNFSEIPENAKVFEIGSANGENSKYIKSLGYDITASDTVKPFLRCLQNEGLKYIKFNALTDEFIESYFAIFCWRVFVHFTKEDALKVIKKVYNNLEKNGIFIFNALNWDLKRIDNEWLDYEGEYHIGSERFFNYFKREDLEEMIKQLNFQIKYFDYQGDDNKWMVYVLKKR